MKSLALASKPHILENCPVLGSRTEAALFFEPLKVCWKTPETSRKICEDFFVILHWRSPEKKFFEAPFFWRLPEKKFLEIIFFWRTLAPESLARGLGLEHSCPWPQEDLSSEGLSLALASDFFVSLALASNLVSSTPPLLAGITALSTEKFTLHTLYNQG